jgi:hypothetical protein
MSAVETYTQVDGEVTITARQRRKALELIKQDPTLGNKPALRLAGVKGTRGQIGAAIDDGFREAALEARGWRLQSVLNALYSVAVDPSHDHWDRGNARFLKAFGGWRFRDNVNVEVTGRDGGPVQLEDRSASLDDVARVLEAVGAFANVGGGAARAALPVVEHVLPDSSEG